VRSMAMISARSCFRAVSAPAFASSFKRSVLSPLARLGTADPPAHDATPVRGSLIRGTVRRQSARAIQSINPSSFSPAWAFLRGRSRGHRRGLWRAPTSTRVVPERR
jgi:hypothetical protein